MSLKSIENDKNLVFVSKNLKKSFLEYLEIRANYFQIPSQNVVYDNISRHADLFVFSLGNKAIISPNLFKSVEKKYSNFNLIKGNTILKKKYPYDIAYNIAFTGKYAIHNFKYTDIVAYNLLLDNNIELLDIKQGYSKCSIVVVDENSIITSDLGIYERLKNKLDVLLISEGYVKLSGFKYGFLGGASGKINGELIFYGNLEKHIDFKKIINFIERKNVEYKYFADFELEDIGSIIEIRRK